MPIMAAEQFDRDTPSNTDGDDNLTTQVATTEGVKNEAAIAIAVSLLFHYFELDIPSARGMAHMWAQRYPIDWISPAVLESLYQGRYRAVSVEQILGIWKRRNTPISHYPSEFARMFASIPPLPDKVAILTQTRIPPRQKLTVVPARASVLPSPIPLVRVSRSVPKTGLGHGASHVPIGQFTPATDRSGFSAKLKSLAVQG
jgi:hypothetical protein